jgi:putative transposase
VIKVKLVERHIVKNNKAIEDICFKTARLYNFCNYYRRQVCFGTLEKFGEYELSSLLNEYKQEDFKSLPCSTAQQVIKLLFKNWNSYFKSIKDYNKNPSKYLGRPRIPKYIDPDGYYVCVFTTNQVKLKSGYVKFPKRTRIEPLKTKVDNIAQVRIVPQANCFVIEVIYDKKIEKNNEIKEENFLALDLGLNNLATSINNVGQKPFIINGKVLKSKNQIFNKTKAKLMSYVGNKGTSNRIKQLSLYRNNFIEDSIHKSSRFIIDYCIENKIGTIVIGKNKGWKDSINIGSVNNQKFVCVPHAKLIDKIKYKAELVGIKVIVHEESYTSKIDHLALEEMKKQENYLGKRKKRGLFQSSTKKLINADVNGAIGIARKVFGDSVVKLIIDSGLAFNPVRINVLSNNFKSNK